MSIDPITFGRVLQSLDDIKGELREIKTRHVFRMDNLEERVEVLEQAQPANENRNKWVDWAVAGFVGLGAASLGIHFGG